MEMTQKGYNMKTSSTYMTIIVSVLLSLGTFVQAASQSDQSKATDLVLITQSEAAELRLTDEDLLTPIGTPPLSTDGPLILLRRPEVIKKGKTALINTGSPTDLMILFEPNQAPINMQSLKVQARKSFFKKSLTKRLQPYIRGTSIIAHNVELPSGNFLIEIEIADQVGDTTFQRYRIKVQ